MVRNTFKNVDLTQMGRTLRSQLEKFVIMGSFGSFNVFEQEG